MEKHGFCHAILFAKTLLLQKHHVRNSCSRSFCSFCSFCSSVRLLFCRYTSNQFHSAALNIVVDSDVALSG